VRRIANNGKQDEDVRYSVSTVYVFKIFLYNACTKWM